MKQQRVPLSTGITLNVATAGDPDGKPVILLHGFPESHRTWRGLAPLLDEFRLIMPDQRGFGGSDRPPGVSAYTADRLVDDLDALSDALEIRRFALIGHDWGGAVAWAAALRGEPRIERLGIINSPHPLIFQRSLIENADQRAASQYMTLFKQDGMAEAIRRMGFETFFEKSFRPHVDPSSIPDEERETYIAQWSADGAMDAMLNWYRAGRMVVPAPGERALRPDWIDRDFPKLKLPIHIVWGMKDPALLACQLEGLDELAHNYSITRIEDAGHFIPWEKPEAVADALKPFLAAARL